MLKKKSVRFVEDTQRTVDAEKNDERAPGSGTRSEADEERVPASTFIYCDRTGRDNGVDQHCN